MKVSVRYATPDEINPTIQTATPYDLELQITGELSNVAIWLDEHMMFETISGGYDYSQGAALPAIEKWLEHGGVSTIWNGFTLFCERALS